MRDIFAKLGCSHGLIVINHSKLIIGMACLVRYVFSAYHTILMSIKLDQELK